MDLRKKVKQDTFEIQVTMAAETKRAEIKQNGNCAGEHVPLIDQAIRATFGLPEIVRDSNAFSVLSNASQNESFAIKSFYPLDDSFLAGLRALGFEIVEQNAKFSTSDLSKYNALHSNSVTLVVKRREEVAAVDSLIFENALHPDMFAAHTLGAISRWADIAKSPAALHFSVIFALEFLFHVTKKGAIDAERFEKLESEYLLKLGEKESQKMNRMGFEGKYPQSALDLAEPMNLAARSRLQKLLVKRMQKLDSAFRRHELAAKLK